MFDRKRPPEGAPLACHNADYLVYEVAESTARDVALKAGLNPSTLFRLCSGRTTRPDLHTLERLAAQFSVSVLDLTQKDLRKIRTQVNRESGNVAPLPKRGRSIPVLEWQDVAQMYVSGFDRPSTARHVESNSELSPKSIAVVIQGDSMAPDFPAGTVVIFDPELAPKHDDYVLAQDPVTGAPTFKRLALDAGRWFLVPLNRAYPTSQPVTLAVHVTAVAVESQQIRNLRA